MLDLLRKKPLMTREAMKAKFMPKAALQLVIFIGIFLLSQLVAGIVAGLAFAITHLMELLNDPMIAMESESLTVYMLYATVIATVLVVVYCRFIERRSLSSMGFIKTGALKHYMIGLMIGFAMFGTAVLIAVVTGSMTYEGYVLGSGAGMIAVFFVGFLLQGMSEEVILRGYLMISLSTKKSIGFAIVANSLLFAAFHLLNTGVTILAVFNLILYGVFASVYMLSTNNIWGIAAIHSMWNFVQGNVFGIYVSGIEVSNSVFSFVTKGESSLINGGRFGLEGGLAVTIVLILGTVLTVMLKKPSVEESIDHSVEMVVDDTLID